MVKAIPEGVRRYVGYNLMSYREIAHRMGVLENTISRALTLSGTTSAKSWGDIVTLYEILRAAGYSHEAIAGMPLGDLFDLDRLASDLLAEKLGEAGGSDGS